MKEENNTHSAVFARFVSDADNGLEAFPGKGIEHVVELAGCKYTKKGNMLIPGSRFTYKKKLVAAGEIWNK